MDNQNNTSQEPDINRSTGEFNRWLDEKRVELNVVNKYFREAMVRIKEFDVDPMVTAIALDALTKHSKEYEEFSDLDRAMIDRYSSMLLDHAKRISQEEMPENNPMLQAIQKMMPGINLKFVAIGPKQRE